MIFGLKNGILLLNIIYINDAHNVYHSFYHCLTYIIYPMTILDSLYHYVIGYPFSFQQTLKKILDII